MINYDELGGILMKKIFSLVIALVLCLSVVGCSNSNTKSGSKGTEKSSAKVDAGDTEITDILKSKVQALNDKKFDDYMKFYDEKSSIYNSVKNTKKPYFSDDYKVNVKILNSTVLNKSKNAAQIQVVEQSTKTKGPGFLDNKVLYVDYLKKIDDSWKITNEVVLKTEFDDPIYAVIYKNVQAANDKKIDDYMETIDSTDQNYYDNTKDSMLSTFNKYDVKYTLEQADISKKSNDDTNVEFTETLIDTKTSGYVDQRVVGTFHLKIVNGEWKIFKIWTSTKKTYNIDQYGNKLK